MLRHQSMQLCRLCLKEDQVNIAIFEEHEGEGLQLLKISSCLPIIITKNDKFPKKICVNCSAKLDCFYEFRNEAIEAEKQLNLWLKENDCSLEIEETNVQHLDVRDSVNNNTLVGVAEIKKETVDSDDEMLINKVNTKSSIQTIPSKRTRRACAKKKNLKSLQHSDCEDKILTGDESEDENFSSHCSFSQDEESRCDEAVPNSPSSNTQNSNHLVPIVELLEGSWLHNEDITSPFAAQIHNTLKKLGYKNPFVYPELKNKKKSLKKLESKNNTKWQCMICSDVKINKAELMEHYEIHKSETESIKGNKIIGDYFMCPVCLTDFTSLISYEKHVELNHGEKQYNCDICSRAFKNLYSLSVHNHKRHCADKIFKCAGCDFQDIDLKSLRTHIRNFHEQHVKYRCEICNKGFSSLSWYQEHKNFHTGAMPFECEVCSKNFPYTRYLIAHKKNMHPEMFSTVPINHECEICQKKFAHKKSLVLHLRGHSGESAVLCDMCGKSLSSSEHLKQHLRIHTGYKPHCCSVCGKGFAKKCNLTLHERVHSGEKPHVCNVCGKGFSQRSTLVIHGRYHSGERPYQCQICQKGFVAKGLLGVHMKTCIGIPD